MWNIKTKTMTPDTIALGIVFFSRAYAEAENEIEALKIKDVAYDWNIPIQDDSLFENMKIFKP